MGDKFCDTPFHWTWHLGLALEVVIPGRIMCLSKIGGDQCYLSIFTEPIQYNGSRLFAFCTYGVIRKDGIPTSQLEKNNRPPLIFQKKTINPVQMGAWQQ